MKKNKRFSEKDFKKIMKEAARLSMKRRDEVSIEDIKEIAADLGLSEKDIENAYTMLEEKKERARNLWGVVITASITILVFASLFAGVFYLKTHHPPFEGQVTVTMTTKVTDDFKCADQLEEIDLSKTSMVYTHLKMKGTVYPYTITWEYKDPDGNIIERDDLNLNAVSHKTSYAFDPIELEENTKPGIYKVTIYLDGQPVQEKEIKVVRGRKN